ncbi:AraC family transcriptional regulator [Variovorax paradoxus]|jgi:AraC-like DNA-binding protein|uniref:AraC family transcriptional regulator n=1 Tax=Variovorax paradoxus TaxID=34073 RepID=UPI003D653B0F
MQRCQAQAAGFELVGSYGMELEAPVHSVLGLGALLAEMAGQGVSAEVVLGGSGLEARQLVDPEVRMSHRQKITIFRNAQRMAGLPDVGLRAGARQRLSDFGVYGYALTSSAAFGDAVMLGMKYLKLAGPVVHKRFRLLGDTALLEGVDVLSLGSVLPLATEFWLASMLQLATNILAAPFPSQCLRLPYPRPVHAAAYERMFGCPVHFGAPLIEWEFDAAVLRMACPGANPATARLCASFCDQIMRTQPEGGGLADQIRAVCLSNQGRMSNADAVARLLGLSVRTMHRRLAEDGLGFQAIADEVRQAIAASLLRNSPLSIDEIAERVGFSEAANFRKAFRRWTGLSPTQYRLQVQAKS